MMFVVVGRGTRCCHGLVPTISLFLEIVVGHGPIMRFHVLPLDTWDGSRRADTSAVGTINWPLPVFMFLCQGFFDNDHIILAFYSKSKLLFDFYRK